MDYYKNNPNILEEDSKKGEIIIDAKCDEYKDITHTIIKDNIKHKLYDVAYIQGVGNKLSNGKGKEIDNYNGVGHHPCVIVYLEKNNKYPYGVAEFNEENNNLGEFIGWYKDESVATRVDILETVIERPIVSKVISTENVEGGYWQQIDDSLYFFSNYNSFPNTISAIDEEGKYGLKVGYSEELPEDFSIRGYLPGLYLANIYLKGDEEKVRVKFKCEEDLIAKKYIRK